MRTSSFLEAFGYLLASSVAASTPLEEIPVVFKNFKDDSAGNQLIITIESWGLINDSITQEALQAYLSTMITKKGYNTQWGTSPFNGPTTSAAMRQLVGVTGKYEYFFHHKTDTNSLYSIFDYKKNLRQILKNLLFIQSKKTFTIVIANPCSNKRISNNRDSSKNIIAYIFAIKYFGN